MTDITFSTDLSKALKKAESLHLIAPDHAWKKKWAQKVLPKRIYARLKPLLSELKPGNGGSTVETITGKTPNHLYASSLPDKGSRHNSPTRLDAVFSAARRSATKGKTMMILALDDPAHALGALVGVARAHPLFERKSGNTKKTRALEIVLTDAEGKPHKLDKKTKDAVAAVRWAARMVDTPTSELTTEAFVTEAKALLRGVPKTKLEVIVGGDLKKKKLGGIHAVGRAAMVAPRLLIVDYRPAKSQKTIALVGKGIVYDTGGLSLKPTASMSSMKGDMGGAAAVLATFKVLAANNCPHRILAFAALAENSIGPDSYRNDDILTLHSGHTVEINNTDAEGRLLLGDAVSYAARNYKPDVILNIATLTGAQPIATGIRHGAVVSNREALEQSAVRAGRESGDLVFPLPFAPEFFQSEFKSAVADMKNSVSSRANAQSSCAAQFVYNHIDDLDIPWAHFDIAGPSFREERGTGYGVALLTHLVSTLKSADFAPDNSTK